MHAVLLSPSSISILQQLTHVLSMLSDLGRPVMLVGPDGCGKTSIVNERIRTVCSGEVAEVLALTIQANK
jgi:ATP-dependent Clp protease ATP-binding subunit ClpA